jgi:putative AdoMet-dependent methyltransferase
MLNGYGFDLWADGYDDTVRQTEAENLYPFAGYSSMMNAIFGTVMQDAPARVLDVGLGTGVLAQKLYHAGCEITGIDFSSEMLVIARREMPCATLLQWDFALGIPPAIEKQSCDFVISTYALHHLAGEEQEVLIDSLLGLGRVDTN